MGLIKDAAGGLAGGGLLGAGLSMVDGAMQRRNQKKRGDDSMIGMPGSSGDPDPVDDDSVGSTKKRGAQRGGALRRIARGYSGR